MDHTILFHFCFSFLLLYNLNTKILFWMQMHFAHAILILIHGILGIYFECVSIQLTLISLISVVLSCFKWYFDIIQHVHVRMAFFVNSMRFPRKTLIITARNVKHFIWKTKLLHICVEYPYIAYCPLAMIQSIFEIEQFSSKLFVKAIRLDHTVAYLFNKMLLFNVSTRSPNLFSMWW